MLLANRSFNNLFDDMFSDPFFTRSYDRSSSQVMRTDIHETGDHYVIEIELPGYAKEEIKADLKDGYLTITAHKNETKRRRRPGANVSTRSATPAPATGASMWARTSPRRISKLPSRTAFSVSSFQRKWRNRRSSQS